MSIKTNQNYESFNLEDILNNNTQIVDDLIKQFKPLEYWDVYLKFGYYPFYFNDEKNFLNLLYSSINLTIEVDLVNLGLIKTNFIDKFKKLLTVVCQSEPFSINISKIASLTGLSRNSIYLYLQYLNKAQLLSIIDNDKSGLSKLAKPDKIYLNNTNQLFAMCNEHKIGTVRETFFANQLKSMHKLQSSSQGDFIVDNKYIIEVGGKNKSFKQIKDLKNSYLAVDNDFTVNQNKIPLWLFGFLY